MRVEYFPETDTLYIDLKDKPGTGSKEIANGIVLDFDSDGNLVGIEIDNARKNASISKLEAISLPVKNYVVA